MVLFNRSNMEVTLQYFPGPSFLYTKVTMMGASCSRCSQSLPPTLMHFSILSRNLPLTVFLFSVVASHRVHFRIEMLHIKQFQCLELFKMRKYFVQVQSHSQTNVYLCSKQNLIYATGYKKILMCYARGFFL